MKSIEKPLYLLICAYIILLPLIPSQINIKYVHLVPNLILALVIVLFLLNIISCKTKRKEFINYVKDFFRDYIGIFLTVLLFIMLVSVSYAVDKKLALSESLRFLSYIILYFIIKYYIKTKDAIYGVMHAYIFIIAIISVISLVQYFTGIGLDNKFVYQYGNTAAMDRIAATLENPNSLGAFLVIGFFPSIMLMIKEKAKNKKILYILLLLVMLFDIFATYSRNAWIGLLIGCLVLAIIYNWKVLIGLGTIGVITLFIPKLSHRFVSALSTSSNVDRIKLWETAIKMFRKHPFTGVGNGNYITLYDNYVNSYPELKYLNYSNYPSHNSYLKVASELGIFGLIAFIGVLANSVLKLRKLLKLTQDDYYKAFFTGFLASVVAFLVMNFSDNMFFIPNTTTYFWVFIALADNLLYKNKTSQNIYN